MSSTAPHTRPPRTHRRSLLAVVATAALVLGGSLVAAAPASAADGTITGTVFRDFNQNGRFDTGNAPNSGLANDRGLGGVIVTAVDGDGTVVASSTSAADGSYTLAVTGARSSAVRVQFSGWSAPYEPSGTSSAGSNGTSVQFVQLGASGVDFALNVPEDYVQNASPVVIAIQRAGSPRADEGGTPASRDAPAVAGVRYSAGLTAPQTGFPGMVTLATFGEVGAVDGLVYQPASNSLLALAAYKRDSGLGSLGIGGIYRISDALDGSGDPSDAGSVTPWLDVASLGIDLGTAPSNTARGIGSPTTGALDLDGFRNAGKIGFGGATLSSDGTTLYFVNLHDKKLYAIDVSDIEAPPSSFRSWDLGLGVGERPWAVSVYRGQLYVGYVDSGETAGGPQPGQPAADAGMHGHVIAAPLAGDGAPGTFTQVLDVDLGYQKGEVYYGVLAPQETRWNSWTDTWAWSGGAVGGHDDVDGGDWQIYPQPILRGLYFDEDGYLSLGFADRTSLQSDNRGPAADPALTGEWESASGGDILLAAPNGDGTFRLEDNASAGSRTGYTGSGDGVGNGEGPGGGEFYNDRNDLGAETLHRENALGAVGGLRGSGSVLGSVYDPLDGERLGGMTWFRSDDGRAVAGYEVTVDGTSGGGSDPSSPDGGFQKGGGLGSVTLLAESAPVEIGNRVWFDADQDGVQDADEPAVQGVTVQLKDASGAVVATRTTDADGRYFFRSAEDGFDPRGSYTVHFVRELAGTVTLTGPNSTAFGALDWSGIRFTDAGRGGDAGLDSDADPATGDAAVTLEGPGRNDHDIDAGLAADVRFTVQKLIDTGGGTPEPGQTFAIDVAARDFRGDAYPVSPSQVTLAGGATSAAITVPVGTAVKVTEDSTGIKTVAIAGPGVADGDGYHLLTASPTVYAFRVTNTLFSSGAFQVTKKASGDFDLDDPELAEASFTVSYSYPGGSGQLVLNAANGWTATSPSLPYHTQVTLTESGRAGAAPSVGFVGTPGWSQGDDDGDGTAVITIGDGTTTQLVLTNPTTELTGGFSITKRVTGPAAGMVIGDPEYVVNYSSAAGSGQLRVRDGQTVDGPVLPTGTVVTLGEVLPAQGLLPDGAAWGVPSLQVDGVTQGNGSTFVIGDGTTVQIVVVNPTSTTPGVEIHKGDGDAATGTIVHEADTVGDGEAYAVGETRDIVIRVSNTGPEPLREVTLSDTLRAGSAISNLVFAFPDGTTASAHFDAATGVWTAAWAATFAPQTTVWQPGEVIVGTATLTMGPGASAHQDRVRVEAVSTISETPVEDENDYNALSAGIQVVKYDGERNDPIVRDGTGWLVPAKPLADASQDANDDAHAVTYPSGVGQKVRWVVTNTGSTWLTELDLADVTTKGPAVTSWTADLSAFGGPAAYDFVASGTWHGLFPPGASFFAEGVLTLDAAADHADTVQVEASPIAPETDDDGLPTGSPQLDGSGDPVLVLDDTHRPVRVGDSDPFHAVTPRPAGTLASSGLEAPIEPLAGGALLLLALGAGVLLVARARRRS